MNTWRRCAGACNVILVLAFTYSTVLAQNRLWERDFVEYGTYFSLQGGVSIRDMVRLSDDSVFVIAERAGGSSVFCLVGRELSLVDAIGGDSLTLQSPYQYSAKVGYANPSRMEVLLRAGSSASWKPVLFRYSHDGVRIDTLPCSPANNTCTIAGNPLSASRDGCYFLSGSNMEKPDLGKKTSSQYLLVLDSSLNVLRRTKYWYADTLEYNSLSISVDDKRRSLVCGDAYCCVPDYDYIEHYVIMFDSNGAITKKLLLQDSASIFYSMRISEDRILVAGHILWKSPFTLYSAYVAIVDTSGVVKCRRVFRDCVLPSIIQGRSFGFLAVGGQYHSLTDKSVHQVILRLDDSLNVLWRTDDTVVSRNNYLASVVMKNRVLNSYLVAGSRKDGSLFLSEFVDSRLSEVDYNLRHRYQGLRIMCNFPILEVMFPDDQEKLDENARFEIVDVLGKKCARISPIDVSRSVVRLELPTTLASGLYYIRSTNSTLGGVGFFSVYR